VLGDIRAKGCPAVRYWRLALRLCQRCSRQAPAPPRIAKGPLCNTPKRELSKCPRGDHARAIIPADKNLHSERADHNQIAMPHSISTLLTRNLHDVFGENNPARRRAAIDEIFTEDGVFYDSSGASTVAATRLIALRARSGLLILTFNISQLPSRRN
jgi:hypothetical protein